MRGKINICQPGHGASCALCCGSHNFVGSMDAMRSEFMQRSRNLEVCAPKTTTTAGPRSYNTTEAAGLRPLHDDAISCPHVGFIDAEQTLIGCLIYDLSPKPAATRNFFEATCRRFSCLAREMLDDSEVLFAARLLGDWYYYGLLINSIQLLRELIRAFNIPENVPESRLLELKMELEAMIKTIE